MPSALLNEQHARATAPRWASLLHPRIVQFSIKKWTMVRVATTPVNSAFARPFATPARPRRLCVSLARFTRGEGLNYRHFARATWRGRGALLTLCARRMSGFPRWRCRQPRSASGDLSHVVDNTCARTVSPIAHSDSGMSAKAQRSPRTQSERERGIDNSSSIFAAFAFSASLRSAGVHGRGSRGKEHAVKPEQLRGLCRDWPAASFPGQRLSTRTRALPAPVWPPVACSVSALRGGGPMHEA
jgi:hypothetical protein